MARSVSEEETLRNRAKELVLALNISDEILEKLLTWPEISGKDDVQLAPVETTGENDFRYEQSPNVSAVVVDKGSERGFVQITGGGKSTERVDTGRGDKGFTLVEILTGQTCMLYGRPTVLYIQPRT